MWVSGGEEEEGGRTHSPSRLSIVQYGFSTRFRRANCTVWIVALLPEPWKARRVGLTLSCGGESAVGSVVDIVDCGTVMSGLSPFSSSLSLSLPTLPQRPSRPSSNNLAEVRRFALFPKHKAEREVSSLSLEVWVNG